MKLYLDSNSFIDTADFTDLSIAVSDQGVRAWYLNPPQLTPVMENGFVGSVKQGGAVNFRNIFFNPHGHGTHTESHGHISEEIFSVSACFKQFIYRAQLISIEPELRGEDRVITSEQLQHFSFTTEALVIRTLPNSESKKQKDYSNSNPPYMDLACVDIINAMGVKHLLLDLPSVDKEIDGGVLAFHHAFWNVPNHPDSSRTITELIYVPNELSDGAYLLELQVSNFENDAAPSRPILYPIKKEA